MAMQPARPPFYYDLRTLSGKRQRGTMTTHPPTIHPFQRNRVRHMAAMAKGANPRAPFFISEEELAGGLGWLEPAWALHTCAVHRRAPPR
jgi:hypothetical protein